MNATPASHPGLLLAELRSKGIRVYAVGEKLGYEAPTGVVTPAILESLRLHKRELLGQLEREELRPRLHEGLVAASYAQERMWFMARLDVEARTFNLARVRRFDAPFDLAVLVRALHEIVRRHEALRTTFVEVEGKLYQRIDDGSRFALTRLEARGETSSERDASVHDQISAELSRLYDLEAGPLVRAVVGRLDSGDHVVGIGMHHAIGDAWSTGVFWSELTDLYAAFSEGKSSPLTDVAIQYADYALWQRRMVEDGLAVGGELAQWKQWLAGVTPLDLPLDRSRPSIKGNRAGFVTGVAASGALYSRLRELASREGATLFMVLLAAFDALLARWSRQQEVVVGTLTAGRTRPEVERILGPFMNTLALRTSLEGDPSFRELLGRVKQTCVTAFANQTVPFERVIEAANVPRDPSRAPIVQAMINLLSAEGGAGGGDTAKTSGSGAAPAPEEALGGWGVDLYLILNDTGGTVTSYIQYDAALFERSTIERFTDRFTSLLQAAADDPGAKVSALSLMSPAERRLVEVEWNATDHVLGESRVVHEIFEAQASRTPAAVALDFESTEVTYGELDARANQLAHALVRQGVKPGDIVAVCMERSIEMVIALYAVLKAGGAYAPLDPSHPAERLHFLVKDLQTPVVLVTTGTSALMAGVGAAVLRVDVDVDESLPMSKLAVAGDAGRAAYVIYTSGSTGMPKGVVNVHEGLRNRLLWMQAEYGLGERDVVLQKTPYTFDVSVWELFWPLMFGARLVIAKPDGHKDPQYLADVIRERAVTTAHFVPSMLAAFLEHADARSCTSLQRVICSGEALPRAMQTRFFEIFDTCELHNLYGPTEASIDVSFWACRRADTLGEVPIGRPIWNTQLYVLDHAGAPCPIGVPGELCIAGVGLARGYWARPELTAEKFVPDPLSNKPGARMYRTGDLARWRADGTLEYQGRIDHQVKLRGLRIELGEIEAGILAEPGVQAAVVTVHTDAAGEKRLVAYVSPSQVDVDRAKAALKQRLPEYMVPHVFVRLDALPLTPSGKIDRKALPAPDLSAKASDYAAPQNPLEEFLADTFAHVLGIERVGIHDDFFALGGHSLLLMRVIAAIREGVGKEVLVREFFEAPTVEGLAQRLRANPEHASPPALVRSDVASGSLTSFFQDFILHWEKRRARSETWSMGFAVDLRGPLDVPRLERALHLMLERQESLRQVFDVNVDGWAPRLCRPEDITIVRRDVRGLDDEAVSREMHEQANLVFALSGGPLIHFTLFERGSTDHTLTIGFHQLIQDPAQQSMIASELLEHYAAIGEGRPPRLPALTVRHVDYAKWERDWFATSAGRADVEAAQKHVSGVRGLRFADRPDAPLVTAEKISGPFAIDPATWQAFEAMCRAASVTTFMGLTALVGVMLEHWSGDDELVIVAPVNLRNLRPQLSPLAGRFGNLLSVRLSTAGNPTWRELLKRTRAAVLDAYEHEWTPFSLVFGTSTPLDDPRGRVLINYLGNLTPESEVPPSTPLADGDRLRAKIRFLGGRSGARNDAFFMFNTNAGCLNGFVGAAADRFDVATVRQRATELCALISRARLDERVFMRSG